MSLCRLRGDRLAGSVVTGGDSAGGSHRRCLGVEVVLAGFEDLVVDGVKVLLEDGGRDEGGALRRERPVEAGEALVCLVQEFAGKVRYLYEVFVVDRDEGEALLVVERPEESVVAVLEDVLPCPLLENDGGNELVDG